jgi:hypothetical protein
MTQEEKRIKLAEVGGWRKSPVTKKWIHKSAETDRYFNAAWRSESDLPDYFNDLNAVHKLEQQTWSKELNLRDDFCDHLALIIDPVHGYRGLKATDALQANAAQRAEALGLTLKLW